MSLLPGLNQPTAKIDTTNNTSNTQNTQNTQNTSSEASYDFGHAKKFDDWVSRCSMNQNSISIVGKGGGGDDNKSSFLDGLGNAFKGLGEAFKGGAALAEAIGGGSGAGAGGGVDELGDYDTSAEQKALGDVNKEIADFGNTINTDASIGSRSADAETKLHADGKALDGMAVNLMQNKINVSEQKISAALAKNDSDTKVAEDQKGQTQQAADKNQVDTEEGTKKYSDAKETAQTNKESAAEEVKTGQANVNEAENAKKTLDAQEKKIDEASDKADEQKNQLTKDYGKVHTAATQARAKANSLAKQVPKDTSDPNYQNAKKAAEQAEVEAKNLEEKEADLKKKADAAGVTADELKEAVKDANDAAIKAREQVNVAKANYDEAKAAADKAEKEIETIETNAEAFDTAMAKQKTSIDNAMAEVEGQIATLKEQGASIKDAAATIQNKNQIARQLHTEMTSSAERAQSLHMAKTDRGKAEVEANKGGKAEVDALGKDNNPGNGKGAELDLSENVKFMHTGDVGYQNSKDSKGVGDKNKQNDSITTGLTGSHGLGGENAGDTSVVGKVKSFLENNPGAKIPASQQQNMAETIRFAARLADAEHTGAENGNKNYWADGSKGNMHTQAQKDLQYLCQEYDKSFGEGASAKLLDHNQKRLVN